MHHSRSWQIHGTPARCTLQFVRWCYGLRGIYSRFDSKIRFEIESDGRFDKNAKKRFAGPYCRQDYTNVLAYTVMHTHCVQNILE